MSTELVMLSNYLILCGPLLLLPSIFPSIGVFSNESALLITWPKYWSFSFSISPSNDYSGLISFRIDWFDLLAVQRTLNSIVASKYHSSKESTLFSFFYNPALTSRFDYWKKYSFDHMDLCHMMMSLLFNTLSRFVTEEQASFNLMAVVTISSDLGVQEKKICHCLHFLLFYLP